jgi:hypothetical protein
MTGNLAAKQEKRFLHEAIDVHAFRFGVGFLAERAQSIDYLVCSMHVANNASCRCAALLQVRRAKIEIPNAYVTVGSNGGKRLFQFMP